MRKPGRVMSAGVQAGDAEFLQNLNKTQQQLDQKGAGLIGLAPSDLGQLDALKTYRLYHISSKRFLPLLHPVV